MGKKAEKTAKKEEKATMKLILATNNSHKINEMRAILGDRFEEILSLKEAGICHETVEDADTFLGNARKKADEIAAISGCPALADDSGLSVDALDGAPGIFSARFAGEHGNDEANNALLLEKLKDKTNRKAHYTCAVVIAYPDGTHIEAEGHWYGEILEAPRGVSGFGYDPIFRPDGESRSVAEMTAEEKNKVSHRSLALGKLYRKLSAR